MLRSIVRGVLALSLVSSSLTIVALPTHAQSLGDSSPISVDVSPTYPSPYQTVTITPDSSEFDMANSSVSVTVNGKSFYKGSGSENISVPVGGPGSVTTIRVAITNGGQTYSQTVTIHPESVALVVDPDSTTHPFYAGAPLVAPEGHVRVIAIPDLRTSAGKQLNPSSLVYTWKLGDQILESDSGIGKNILNANAPDRYQDAQVSVTVSSADGSLTGQAQTTVAAVDPITRIYFNDPLLGPEFDNALNGTVAMPDTEDTYRGVAYYFSDTPTYEWDVAGTNDGNEPDITVRATGGGSGTASLSFTATDPNNQKTANSTLAVRFGQKSLGIFGL